MSMRAAISEREQIAQLRAENLWLRAELGLLMDEEQIAEIRTAFRVSPMEAKLLLHLVNARLVTKESAMHSLAEAGYDYEADQKVVDVYVCKLRRVLRRAGGFDAIETIWSTGYRLTQEGRRLVASRLGQVVAP